MKLNVLSITPKKNEISWINSQFRNRIIHIYNKKKLNEFFKNISEDNDYSKEKDKYNYFYLKILSSN